MTRRVLVTGIGGPASTNVVKSLRLAPERIFVVGTEINKYRIYLSKADKSYLVPTAASSDYIEEINNVIEQEGVEFVFPQPDVEVRVLGENRSRLKAKTFLPAQKTILICQNKFKSYLKWKEADIPVPKSFEIHNSEEALEVLRSEINPPVWIRADQGAGGRGSSIAWDHATITSWVSYWRCRNVNWNFIIQKYLPGRNIAWHSIWKEGELITSMARERLEYIYPYLSPSGVTGTPTVQKTIRDEAVNDVASKAVLAIDPCYTGLACVDLKEDDDGVPNPTEINPGRMFTTSYFFSYASKKLLDNWSVNLPYLCVKLGYDEALPDICKFNPLPADIYWLRHIDMNSKMIYRGKPVDEG